MPDSKSRARVERMLRGDFRSDDLTGLLLMLEIVAMDANRRGPTFSFRPRCSPHRSIQGPTGPGISQIKAKRPTTPIATR
jgi:hypothetical protein